MELIDFQLLLLFLELVLVCVLQVEVFGLHLLVGTLVCYLPVFENNDSVDILKPFERIGEQNSGFSLQKFAETVVHYEVRDFNVQSRQALVEQVNVAVSVDASSQIDSFPLASAQCIAF